MFAGVNVCLSATADSYPVFWYTILHMQHAYYDLTTTREPQNVKLQSSAEHTHYSFASPFHLFDALVITNEFQFSIDVIGSRRFSLYFFFCFQKKHLQPFFHSVNIFFILFSINTFILIPSVYYLLNYNCERLQNCFIVYYPYKSLHLVENEYRVFNLFGWFQFG